MSYNASVLQDLINTFIIPRSVQLCGWHKHMLGQVGEMGRRSTNAWTS